MKLWLPVLLLVWIVAGCAPLRIYHKPGVPIATWQTDTTRCEVQALRDAPVSERIRQTPPRYIPERKICHKDGKCEYRGGHWIPGRIYTVDVNLPLRNRVTDLCMADRGYQPVEIPPCRSNLTVIGETSRLPPLTETTCFVRRDNGTSAIITPP